MKRILSLCLALCMLFSTLALQVFAEGDVVGPYGSTNGEVDDNLSDAGPVFDKKYAVSFTDFEGLSATYDNGFKIFDSDISEYNSVFYVPALSGSAVPHGISTKYNWEGKEHTLFSEQLEVGEKYLIYFDYYSVPSNTEKDYVFSFTPKHDAFSWFNGQANDHRMHTEYFSDSKWHTQRMAFTATTNKTDIKLNTWGSGVETYIDNYLVMEAAEIVIKDTTSLLEFEPVSNNFAITSAYLSNDVTYMVAKGDNVKFKINAPAYISCAVFDGDKEINANEDGIYSIDKATDDITVEASVSNASLTDAMNDVAITNENDVYVPFGRSVYSLADDFCSVDKFTSTKSLKAIDSSNQKVSIDSKLTTSNQIYYQFGDITSEKFNVKFQGDADENGMLSVTDITSIVSRLVDGTGADKFNAVYDFDANNNVNVTDIVNIRKSILDEPFDTRDAEADIIVKSGVDLDFIEFDKGVYNSGNQAAVANVIRKAMRGEEVILAAFGGSITAEGNASETPVAASGITTTLGTDSYSDVMLNWFESTFSKYGATFKLINAGIGATDTPYAIHRMYEDVMNAIPDKKPDMVIYEWACNDDKADYKQGTFENGVRKFLEEDVAVLIFSFDNRARGGTQYKQEPIADFYDLPLLSYGDSFGTLTEWQYLTNDGTHPNSVGHALAGTIITRYLSGIYNNIDKIGTVVPEIPEETYHADGNIYGETSIARLADIADGKIPGVRIKSPGSFERETTTRSKGNNASYKHDNIVSCNQEYYGYTARQNEEGVYEPLEIEFDDVKTAFILMDRFKNRSDCKFNVYLDDVQLTCPYGSFTCSIGDAKDNMQIEDAYFWVTSRVFYNPEPQKVTLKITPDLGVYNPEQAQKLVRLFAIFISK